MTRPKNPKVVSGGEAGRKLRNSEAGNALKESKLMPDKRLAEVGKSINKPSEVEFIRRHPNLTLVAGEEEVVFKVNSCVLANHSSTWNDVLYGKWKEGKDQQNGKEWAVRLPEDDPQALRIVLFAIHTGGKNLERVLAPATLFHVTVLCDKYDLIASLKPLWRGWLDNLPEISADAESLAHRLWIAHKLGHQEMYESVFRKLLGSCKRISSDSPRIEVADCKPEKYDLYKDVYFKSLDVLPHLERGRSVLLNEVGARLNLTKNDLLQFQNCLASGSVPDWRAMCNSAMLGALYRQLELNDVENWLSSQDLGSVTMESLDWVIGMLEAIRVNAIDDAKMDKRQGGAHEVCTLWMPFTTDTIMALPMVTNLIPIDKEHFKRKAEESGIEVGPVCTDQLPTVGGACLDSDQTSDEDGWRPRTEGQATGAR